MKVQYFKETDTLYIELSEAKSVESEEIADGIVIDYDAKGNVIGIEIEHFTENFKDKAVEIPVKLATV